MLFNPDRDKDTICAVATAPGVGGIAVIRVSGSKAYSITRKLCPTLPLSPESHKLYFSNIKDNAGDVIDEVLVSFFDQGKSFTGDEVCEISCHGNPLLSQGILNELITAGARLAEKGEFTYRAFINEKIDLVQAESVLSLIESQSKQAAKQALGQLKGGLSEEVQALIDKLTLVLANLEANIDYAQEDIIVAENSSLINDLSSIKKNLVNYISSYKQGRLLKEGFKVALVGKPNVGKSSLLNAILGEDKAIVTNIEGTTRDIVEGELLLNGIMVQFFDTAGIRDTFNEVELIGISKTKDVIDEVDLTCVLFDLSKPIESQLELLNTHDFKENTLIIGTKMDTLDTQDTHEVLPSAIGYPMIRLSSKTGNGVGYLFDFISNILNKRSNEYSSVISQSRHYELFIKAEKSVQRALSLLIDDDSPEFIIAELQESLLFLFEVIGQQFDDQVMDKVFSEFCLGK